VEGNGGMKDFTVNAAPTGEGENDDDNFIVKANRER